MEKGNRSGGEHKAERKEKGLALIRQMNEAAETLNDALGLPPEEKFRTLSLLYAENQPNKGGNPAKKGNKPSEKGEA